MPIRNRIDPNRNYLEIDKELRAQFEKKGRSANLRFSEAKGLYVSNSGLELSPHLVVQIGSIPSDRHRRMLDAGREVKDLIRDSINREFPEFTVQGQSLGDVALNAVNNHKLDIWAFRERKRIEKLVEDHYFDNDDIELPYTHTDGQRAQLLGKTLTAKEKEYLLKTLLTDNEKEAVVCQLNGSDIAHIGTQVRRGLHIAAHMHPDREMRNQAHDHLQILDAQDVCPRDAVVRARNAKRHKIIEENRLLRRAIARDLRGNPQFTHGANDAASRIVSNLQTSSSVLTPVNLVRVAELLQNLGCGFENVEGLGNFVSLEQTLQGSILHARGLNASIEKSARQREFRASVDGIREAVRQNNATLEAVTDFVNSGEFEDEGRRATLATRLIESTMALADLCHQPPFKDAPEFSPAYRLAEKMGEQARIANELALALKDASKCNELPSLKKAGLPEVRHSYQSANRTPEKLNEGKRILRGAIADDLRSNMSFRGNADIVAGNIVSQVQFSGSSLTPKNIDAVRGLLSALHLSHANVDGVTELINLDRKLAATIPQIRDLSTAVMREKKSLLKDRRLRAQVDQVRQLRRIEQGNFSIQLAENFLKSGMFDDMKLRNVLHQHLRADFRNMAEHLSYFEGVQNELGSGSPYGSMIGLLEKQMAAVRDLAEALSPPLPDRAGKLSFERFYPLNMHDKWRVDNTDATILDERIEVPLVLFHSDHARWRAQGLLTEPLNNYNGLLGHVRRALGDYKKWHTKVSLERLKDALAAALVLNNHLMPIFGAVNRLRNTGKSGQHDVETPLLKDQQECLQMLQSAAFRVMNPEWPDGSGVKSHKRVKKRQKLNAEVRNPEFKSKHRNVKQYSDLDSVVEGNEPKSEWSDGATLLSTDYGSDGRDTDDDDIIEKPTQHRRGRPLV